MALRRTLGLVTALLVLAACAAPGASPSPTVAPGPTAAAPTGAAPTATAPTATAPTATSAPTATAAATAIATATATTEPSPALTLPPPNPACDRENLELKNPGRLTLSTDIPAFPPWWGGDAAEQYPNEPETGSPWSDAEFSAEPYSMEGFEGAVAYAIADAMGFSPDEVDWLANPVFEQAFAPGEKPFDFHMAQIAITEERAQSVTFTDPYFDSNQAILALTGNEITSATSIEEFRGYRLGAAANTTSFNFLENTIQPTVEPSVFPDNTATVEALKGNLVDGIVVDLSTAFFMRDAQIEDFATDEPEGTIVGQFGPPVEPDHVGAVLDLGNPLAECVNHAIATIKADGRHQTILDEWINTGEEIPFLE
jgi:polar amino acid transport system substrate-binding protein